MNYLIITPVKDEARFIEQTLQSVVSQTQLPKLWVIVDDGSTDTTPEIIERYAASHPFIRLIRKTKRTDRQTGTAEIVAFNVGLNAVNITDFEYIVKLDGDLRFESTYFERLIAHFSVNPKLGIASGVYEEMRGTSWIEIQMPSYHAAGASKVLRRQCFEAIGGFIGKRGWDTVDEIRAMALGWETRHFSELKLKHLKAEGTGMGLLRTCYMHGEIYYGTRGSKLFFALKTLNRMRHQPYLLGGTAMAWGYIDALFRKREPLISIAEGEHYRKLLWKRLVSSSSK